MEKTKRVPPAEMGTMKVCQSCFEWMQGVPDGSLEFLMVFLLSAGGLEVVPESQCEARVVCRYSWGRWKLDASQSVSLNIYPFSDTGKAYYVLLSELEMDSVQGWYEHLREKTWITPMDLFAFRKACAALKKRGFIKITEEV